MRRSSGVRSVPISRSARSRTESAEASACVRSNQRHCPSDTRARSRRSGVIISAHAAMPFAAMNSRHSRCSAGWSRPVGGVGGGQAQQGLGPPAREQEPDGAAERLTHRSGRVRRRPPAPPRARPRRGRRATTRGPGPGHPERPKPRVSKRAIRKRSTQGGEPVGPDLGRGADAVVEDDQRRGSATAAPRR